MNLIHVWTLEEVIESVFEQFEDNALRKHRSFRAQTDLKMFFFTKEQRIKLSNSTNVTNA